MLTLIIISILLFSIYIIYVRVKEKKQVDCQVGNWGEYSECVNENGIIRQHRERKVIKESEYGGKNCPELIEYKSCEQTNKCLYFEMKQYECFKDDKGKWKQLITKDYLNSECDDEITVADCPVDKIPKTDCKNYRLIISDCFKNEIGKWKQQVTKDYMSDDCNNETTIVDCPLSKARLLACKNPLITQNECFKNESGMWKMIEKTNYEDTICEDIEITKDCPTNKIREIVCVNPTIVPYTEKCYKNQTDGKWYKMNKKVYSDPICLDEIFSEECPLPPWPEITGFTKMEKKDYTTINIMSASNINSVKECSTLCKENVYCTGIRMEGDTLDNPVCSMKYNYNEPPIDTDKGVFYKLDTPKHPIIKGYDITLGSNDRNNPYRTIENTTPVECSVICKEDPTCQGFWFEGLPGQTKNCELKSKVGFLRNTGVGVFYNRIDMEGAWPTIDGYKEPQNQKYPTLSPLIERHNMSTLSKCANKCMTNVDCTSFYFNESNSLCELKKYKQGDYLGAIGEKSVFYVKI